MLDKAQLSAEQIAALEAEMIFLSELKKQKGLVQIKDDRLKNLGLKGIIAATCPDGDHFLDVSGHLCRYNQRVHLLALNGGAMLMSPQNKAYELDGAALIRNTSAAWEMGKGKTILLLSHWPCGRARHDVVPVQDVIRQTLEADETITAHLQVSEEVVLPLFHIDWTPFERDPAKKRRRTYFIKSAARALLNA